ncbi:cytochrome c [Sinomicrobium kalidii]|uniref:c-type cytochrome n=1 Tax=Sinomicrobium kalidii TaxID=2900738 RepID=UPI001E4F13D5|nr:c-type cytochrome [Sinomicrobium kalidii]UGU16586.1 cytochrome c [Sinomicrobium kalidii]
MKHVLALSVCFLLSLVVTSCKNGTQKEENTGGTKTAVTTEKPIPVKQAEAAYPEGEKVYKQYCATCHQANGSGVPNLNPPLRETTYVTGDKTELIRIIINGSDAGLEVNGQTYANVMPPHDFLSDRQIAQLLSYIRNSFGNTATPVAEKEVKVIRENTNG